MLFVMRMTYCLRKTMERGFLWGQLYTDFNKWGYLAYGFSVLGLKQFRTKLRQLGDGVHSNRHRPLYKPRHRINTAFVLLQLRTSRVSGPMPWAWALLHKLNIRTYGGLRIRLGLPSRGQRTHTNARTVRRVKDAAAAALRNNYLTFPVWLIRKIPSAKKPGVVSNYGVSKRSIKTQRSKRGVIRTKDLKRKTQWT